ncbi:acyl carrier protein [Streptomyces sp. NPDC058989]|uniref:acyl carrier protein n=1 Tax=Streptomyces sp. NPDC058989 TaxID=3346686 RepID=UPI0036C035D7
MSELVSDPVSDVVSAPLSDPDSALGSGAYTEICTVLTETFGVEPDALRPSATFEELDLDSLALLEFALVMGERLGVSGADADLRPAMTLREASAFVESLRPQACHGPRHPR